VIIAQIRETIQPEIAQHHCVEIESDEITEAEAREDKNSRDQGKRAGRRNGDEQSGRIIKHMKLGRIESVRKLEIGDIDERHAANDYVNANHGAAREMLSQESMISHASCATIAAESLSEAR
jgi:hypothetical protein